MHTAAPWWPLGCPASWPLWLCLSGAMLLTLGCGGGGGRGGTYLPVSGELDCSALDWPRGPGWLSVIWADGSWVGLGNFLGVLFALSLDFHFVTCPCTKQELNHWPQSWCLRTCIRTELEGVLGHLVPLSLRSPERARTPSHMTVGAVPDRSLPFLPRSLLPLGCCSRTPATLQGKVKCG